MEHSILENQAFTPGKSLENGFYRYVENPGLRAGILRAGYTQPTPVQTSSLPAILAGKDALVGAKTGSGKTAAFAIGILNKIDIDSKDPQALVLCPTRELAAQVATQIRVLGSNISQLKTVVLCGGEMIRKQVETLNFGAHIVVATPGRLADHLHRGTVTLTGLKTLVLDEADRMLDMGFEEDLAYITSAIPRSRQTLLFSATFSDEVQALAVSTLDNPEVIRGDEEKVHRSIIQYFYKTKAESKMKTLLAVLAKFKPENVLIFCSMKTQTEEIKTSLLSAGVRTVLTLHGDLEQRERNQVLALFANQSCSALVATDVAARGIDLPRLDLVVNFDLAHDPENHVHRIGRTGRSGKTGIAVSLFTDRESRKLEALETYCGTQFTKSTLTESVDQAWKGVPRYTTLRVNAGKKNKIRKGDILGALTSSGEIKADHVGPITLFDFHTLVAVTQKESRAALNLLNSKPVKAKNIKAQFVNV